MKKQAKLIALLCLFAFSAILSAQEALKSAEEEYYDFLSLQGLAERPTLNYRTLSDSVWTPASDTAETGSLDGNVWGNLNLGTQRTINGNERLVWKIYGPEWFNSFNTAAPYGQNDGALWQGKGYNTSLTAGLRLEGYGVELTLKPQLAFSQNLEFDIMPSAYSNEYGYFWGYGNNLGADHPQRFGDKPFWTFDWGDTEIRYTWKTLTAGFGTQAIWLGPAWLNPVLHSNNAPTYPKFDIGMRRQRVELPFLGWYIGDIEGRMWLGYLSESDYFDSDSGNDHNMISGFSFAYAPSFLPGLTLGATKVCLSKWGDNSWKYINPFYSTNDAEDQKASLTANWLFPSVGFEVYGEYGIDDYADFATYIEHTAVYTVGLKKAVTINKKYNLHGELLFEWNNTEMSQDFQFQWPYSFGFHHQIAQGYTNKGQWIGAGSGYGGNSQFLGFKMYHSRGSILLYYHRANPDNNYIFSKAVNSKAADKVLDGSFPIKSITNYGVAANYFITEKLSVYASFVYNKIRRPLYQNYQWTPNWALQSSIKYNF